MAAETVPQTVQLAKVDVTQVSAGFRASKVIGGTVVNDANDSIGSVDDLLVSPDGKETFAVLSVGGFLEWAASSWWFPMAVSSWATKSPCPADQGWADPVTGVQIRDEVKSQGP